MSVEDELNQLIRQEVSSSVVDLLELPGLPAPVAGSLDVYKTEPYYHVAIFARPDATEKEKKAALAHEAGHIMQYEVGVTVKTEADAIKRGVEFAKKWDVLREYLDFQEQVYRREGAPVALKALQIIREGEGIR